MAEDKNKGVDEPAPATADQKSTGPAATPIAKNETKTYYLRPNARHTALIKGDRVLLDQAGQPAEMSDTQYAAMRDKFFNKEEYAAYRASVNAASGAGAAESVDPATMEQTTPEAHQNATNEPAKGKDTGAGERGTPPKP